MHFTALNCFFFFNEITNYGSVHMYLAAQCLDSYFCFLAYDNYTIFD